MFNIITRVPKFRYLSLLAPVLWCRKWSTGMLAILLFTGIFKVLFILGTVVQASTPSIQKVKEGGSARPS